MNDNKQLKEFINSIRDLAEILGLQRDSLIKNGFSRREAIDLCREYMRSILNKPTQQTNQDDFI